MLKTFTPEYYKNNRGCYSEEKMMNFVKNNSHTTIQDFLNWPIPIKDKFYFVRNYTQLTIRQKQELALECAKVSLKIYEFRYPNDKRVSNCIHAILDFMNNKITRETLLKFKKDAAAAAADAAAYAADAAAYAAYAAAAAAYAYAYAADAAAYAYAYAADAADAAAYAAYAAAAANSEKIHENNLLQVLKDFCDKII